MSERIDLLPWLPRVDHVTYADLYAGEVESVVVYVCPGNMRLDDRLLEKPNGLYVLTAGAFRLICDRVAKEVPRLSRASCNGLEVAKLCDTVSGNDSWIRTSAAAADWIATQEPIGHIFATIG